MKKIFILDDIPARHKNIRAFLQANNPSETFTFHSAQTFVEGIDLIREHEFDLLCLDHDLGDFDPETATPDTGFSGYSGGAGRFLDGRDFCHWLIQRGTKIAAVWVHSWNPVGADRMVKILTDSGVTNITRKEAPGDI